MNVESTLSRVGYVVVDGDLRLGEMSPVFTEIMGDIESGIAIEQALPIFVGMENTLDAILQGSLSYWHVRALAHQVPGRTTPCYLELVALPHPADSNIFLVVRDITTEIELEKVHIQQRNELRLLLQNINQAETMQGLAQRIETANNERTHLLGLVGHELWAPLAAIVGYAEWSLRAEAKDNAHRQVMKSILANAQRAEEVATELLGIDCLQQDLRTMRRRQIDLNSHTGAAMRLCQTLAAEYDVEIQLHGGPAPPVKGVAPLIEEAIVRLLCNGIMYNQPGGAVDVTIATEEDGVLISIHDTGPGIPPDLQDRVFLPFFRGQQAHKPNRQRAGLGLFLVQIIAEAHQGRVWLDSAPGEGSTFFLWLPQDAD